MSGNDRRPVLLSQADSQAASFQERPGDSLASLYTSDDAGTVPLCGGVCGCGVRADAKRTQIVPDGAVRGPSSSAVVGRGYGVRIDADAISLRADFSNALDPLDRAVAVCGNPESKGLRGTSDQIAGVGRRAGSQEMQQPGTAEDVADLKRGQACLP